MQRTQPREAQKAASSLGRASCAAVATLPIPMRADQKYNAVLRAKSGDPFLIKQYRDLCFGNQYISTIHSINSCIIKLSKLTVAGVVYRGVCYGKLPDKFWHPSSEGICGGVEFGFQSTTRERAQAVHYATGCAHG